MRVFYLSVLAGILAAGAAPAGCPETTPSIERWNILEGDKRVNSAWLQEYLAGRRVKYEPSGTEYYQEDGSYAWRDGSQTWNAPSYKFYDSGFRCIDYPDPRFDLYVVSDGHLVLINSGGSRYVGKILK